MKVKGKSGLKASLDMGTTKVSAMIAEVAMGSVRIIGFGNVPSDGMKQGVVVDIEKAAASVERAVQEAERMAGIGMDRYIVGVAGEHIKSMNSRGVVAIPNLEEEISKGDVERALSAARNFTLPFDREIIHTIPQEFIVDNQRGIKQPAGMYGARLEARVHVVTASKPALDNVAKTMESAGIEVEYLVLEPYASSFAVLTEEEKELGVMLIDIGGGTTDVMLFCDGGALASGVIGLGGNNITSDVAYGLRTSIRAAEEIKVGHGCALSSMVSIEERIEVPVLGGSRKREVGRQMLAAVIEPRVAELFSLINDQISANGLKKLLGAGVVLTGGSSVLEGCKELAEQVFDLPVRVGTPARIEGLKEVVEHPMYATGVGLLLYASHADRKGGGRRTASRSLMKSLNQIRRAIASFI